MASITIPNTRPSFSVKLLAGGFVAGMVMGMWQMILQAVIPNGGGLWSPLVYIAATLLRGLQNVATPVAFNLLAVILGLMGHMINSLIFGLIFALLIAPRIRSFAGQVVTGLIYGVVIYVVMWFAIVPLVDPVMLRLNALAFLLGHMMWGIALGLVNHWASAKA